MRQDLLALTPDDLVLLANRGLVKRAQQETQSGELTCTIDEDGQGNVVVRWSDEIECVLPADRHVRESRCSCPATTICRHLIRSVLAYQHATRADSGADRSDQSQEPWNPGAISDEDLARSVSRSGLTWARRNLDERHVIELVRSAKPSAYLHTLHCTVRFLVPGDARYTHCDCAEEAPCRHVPLAVWAFRLLDAAQVSGIVQTGTRSLDVPGVLLAEIEQALRDLVCLGVSSAPQALIERLRRQEMQCRQEELIWPAEIIAEIIQQHTAYTTHDARFTPVLVASLLGELCIRADAIRYDTGAVPQLFIRGAAADTRTAVGTTRLIGLGCGVRTRRGGVELTAYLQDSASGALVAICRDVSDPEDHSGSPVPFWRLAQTPIAQGVSMAAFGAGQALVKGGHRLPNARFIPGRATLNVNPQSYAWETLRAPVLAEDFGELIARITAQPPAALRPRRLTDGLHVCAVAGAQDATFSQVDQEVRATLRDLNGGQARLIQPYTARGQAGTEALLTMLQAQGAELRFVAGYARLTAYGLAITPTALVFQEGATRRIFQPWIAEGTHGETTTPDYVVRRQAQGEPLAEYWMQVGEALGDLLVVGLQRADVGVARRWRELARYGAALGFARTLEAVERLAASLEQKSATLHWEPDSGAEAALRLACLAQIVNPALTGTQGSANGEAS
jgi:hypothetical protein